MAKLDAEFVKTSLLVDHDKDSIPLPIKIKNTGNVPITIFKIDGSCSCRQVDNSTFPVELLPGKQHLVPVKLSVIPRGELDYYRFTVDTNHGSRELMVPLVSFARYALNPNAISSPILGKSEEWSFKVTHRSVVEISAKDDSFDLVVPPSFTAEQIETSGGTIAKYPKFKYKDITYKFKLTNKDIGIKKDIVVVKDQLSRSVAELPVVWQRSEFLGCIPQHAYLNSKPFRVFLKCSDASVELTRVLSAPSGIKAITTSPRELTITLLENAPAIINDHIEVATSAIDQPPLRVPVIRFSIDNQTR